ncbi:hypothetical protein VNI00_007925 [Paramarasmius palmivorus]|uniref:Transmembrane protein n=1 Tax=Paramarasmius palmivorus TaxID=297713 RepID=A0AAW0CXU7_9AGAR
MPTEAQELPSYGIHFPTHGAQIAVAIGYLIILPLMTIMVYTRYPVIATVNEIRTWSMPYSKVTILIALGASWCYIFVGGVLNLGVGLSSSLNECSRGIFLCTWFYTTTKLGVYLFLMERAFIVRGGGVRLKSWHYRFNFFLMFCWLAVFILLEVGRIFALDPKTGTCIFGWEWWALIPLMSLDVFVNFYLVLMFVVPLFTNSFANARLRALAIRALWTAVASTVATLANLVMLIMIKAPGWLCLASCGLDIFLNAALLFYMTRTLKTDDREAKATWTVKGHTATIGSARSKRNNTTNGQSIFVVTEIDQQHDGSQIDLAEMNKGDLEAGNVSQHHLPGRNLRFDSTTNMKS